MQKKETSLWGKAVVFPASLATDNLRQVCPRGDQTGVLPPFCEATPLSLSPVETSLPRLQWKLLVPWGEVSLLLAKGAMEIVDLSWDQGGFYSHYFLTANCIGGFCSIPNLNGLMSFI